jgi:hypothetical protein
MAAFPGAALMIAAMAMPAVVAQDSAVNPRGIFLGGTTLAVSAEIEVERDGKRGMVPSNYEFRSGDRFWMHVSVNRDAYIYVLNRTLTGPGAASRGVKLLADADRKAPAADAYTLVFPAPNTAAPLVRKGTPTTIPGRGLYFAMDDVPGAEKLLVVASETQLTSITSAFDPATGRLAAANRSDSVGAVLDRLNGELVQAAENTASSRDIVIVDAPAPSRGSPPAATAPTSGNKPATSANAPGAGRQSGRGATDTRRPDYGAPKQVGRPMLLELTLAHLPR